MDEKKINLSNVPTWAVITLLSFLGAQIFLMSNNKAEKAIADVGKLNEIVQKHNVDIGILTTNINNITSNIDKFINRQNKVNELILEKIK